MEYLYGFIQAIVEDPQDVVVRLVFADWLQDHGGDAYASFIRVQCELAEPKFAKHPDPHDPAVWQFKSRMPCSRCLQRDALRHREAELLEHNWMAFAGEEVLHLVNFYKRKGVPVFRRGFVESIECTCDRWLKCGSAIVRRQPVLEVRFTDWDQRRNEYGPIPDWLENPVAWARSPHPTLGLEALPPLASRKQTVAT